MWEVDGMRKTPIHWGPHTSHPAGATRRACYAQSNGNGIT